MLPAGLELVFDESANRVTATLKHKLNESGLDRQQLRALIDNQGYGPAALNDKLLDSLAIKIAKGDTGSIELGSIKHTRLDIEIEPSKKELIAKLSDSDSLIPNDASKIRSTLQTIEFSAYSVPDKTVKHLVKKINLNERGTVTLATPPITVVIRLNYDPSSRTLSAVLEKSEIPAEHSSSSLKKMVCDAGFDNYGIKSHIMSDLLQKCQRKQFGAFPIGKKPEYTKVNFFFDEASSIIHADLLSSEDETLNSRSSIQDSLKALSYDDFFFKPNVLDKLLRQANKNERGRFAIGEKKDAQIKIECDDEYMTAFISVSPPFGGRDLDENLLNIELANAGIERARCNEEVIAHILKEKTATQEAFASGSEPKNGEGTVFKALVSEVEHIKPKENKKGKINFRETFNFTEVVTGTPLMRRYPAKPGINGQNVKGQVIPSVDCINIPYNDNLEGSRFSENDPELLLADAKGHPVILKDGVRVDKTIIVNNVDMNTGNIAYDGSVMVKGEIMPGMKVKVTGDIVVQGVVSKASLFAKNNITVHCGIIGSDPSKDDQDSPPSAIKAGGNITAQYVTQSKLSAGNNIEVKEYISHSASEAKNMILVGAEGGKGRIFGGTCHAQTGIQANSLGAEGGIKTFVSAGAPHHQQKQFDKLEKSRQNRVTQADQLKVLQAKFKASITRNPHDIDALKNLKTIEKLLKGISQEIEKMEGATSQLGTFFNEAKKAAIVVKKNAYPNVTLSINGAEFNIRQESKGGIFIKEGADIRWTN